MENLENFDKLSFLKQGAIFAKQDRVWLMWGVPEVSNARPLGPAIATMDFFGTESFRWLQYPAIVEASREKVSSLFRKGPVGVTWQSPDRDLFQTQFDLIQQGFARGTVEKVVPYVFEKSLHRVESADLESFLFSALGHESGFLYGQWEADKGVLGLTPEILISQKQERAFETMALAGTTPLEHFERNPTSFLENHKENSEHQKVVQDIVAQLSLKGAVEVSSTKVLSTPHLAHLLTPIAFTAHSKMSLGDLVTCLHPTPALGTYPRSENSRYMPAFEELIPRGSFGAPFAISYSPAAADVVVAIRNISWNQGEIRIGSGCGIVKESSFDQEWQELNLKRNSVKRIFGIL